MKAIQSLITVTLLVFITSLAHVIGAFATCADCVVDIVPMPGSGQAVNGRRSISVKIAPNLNSSPGTINPFVWNAVFGCTGCPVQGAVQQWNNTTDNGQANGAHIGYFLKQDQSTTSPDILIVKVPAGSLNNGGADAATGAANGPDGKPLPGKRVILLDERALRYEPARLAALIAHEIGHALGLGDNYKKRCTTIVNVVTSTNTPVVQPSDVAMVNQHLGNRGTCLSEQRHPLPNDGGSGEPSPSPTPVGCPDADNDSVCDAQDCND